MVSVAVGLVADRAFGELPTPVHPVAAFGTAMASLERRLHRDSRLAGAVHAAVGVGLGALAGRVVGSTAVATAIAVAGRMLLETATSVGDAVVAGDVERARALLPSLVGRDAADLDEEGIVRAVVESVAENTVDAIVAPAVWALTAGAPGVLIHRAVNTMDAMVGHRSPRHARYGTASARLDDVLAWVPARLTAVLVAGVRPRAAVDVRRTVRRDAAAHPSPNAGVAEAAYAAALGVRLGGTVSYGGVVDHRPPLGDGRPVQAEDIERAVRLTDDVTAALVVLCCLADLR